MYRFNHDQTLFLCVSPDNRITLWDVATNRLKQSFKERAHLKAGYTCVSYRSGRKAQGRTAALSAFGVAALGSDKGHVVVWELAQDSHRRMMHGKSKSRISDVAMLEDASKLYTCSEKSKFVFEWDVASGEICREFVGGKPGVHRLGLSPSGMRMVSSGPNIRLWDLRSGAKLKRFVGHSSPATHLQFIDEDRFVSACEDRFLSIWSCAVASAAKPNKVPLEKKPLFVLAAPSVPRAVAVRTSSERACRILVCTSTDVFAWDMQLKSLSKGSAGSLEPTFTIQASGSTAVALKADKVCVLLRIVGDHHEAETVDLAGLFKQTGKVTLENAEKSVEKAPSLSTEKEEELPTEKNKKVNAEDLTKKVALAGARDASTGATNVDARPMGERVKEMSQKLSKLTEELLMNGEAAAGISSKKRKRQPETAASLSSALEQALQSNDLDMIESCINQSDPGIIGTTVGRLPTSRILQFVDVLVQKYEARPSRSRILFAWIEAILKQHAAFLITVPDLTATLGGLYESVKARAALLDKFVQLSGRLDFIVAQVDIQAEAKLKKGEAAAEKQSETGEATITYDEEA